MKLLKKEIRYLILSVLLWTFINTLLNFLGLWFSKLLKPAEYNCLNSIPKEFILPVLIQSVLFGVCFTAVYLFFKNRKDSFYKKYSSCFFVLVQFVAFHIIFFLNLKLVHGIHFITTFDNIGLRYLSLFGQYLIDILYLYFPINGNFENNMFMPDHLGAFYFHWIFMNLVYYFAISWGTIKAVKFIMRKSTSKKEDRTKIEEESTEKPDNQPQEPDPQTEETMVSE